MGASIRERFFFELPRTEFNYNMLNQNTICKLNFVLITLIGRHGSEVRPLGRQRAPRDGECEFDNYFLIIYF